MKNAEAIKAKALKQIMAILNKMDCYTFTENGIRNWLDNYWEPACSKQIEEIAEPSQYYDGDCKVVFPAEHPREINPYGIDKFRQWIKNNAIKLAEPVEFEGYKNSQVRRLGDWHYQIMNILQQINFEDYFEGEALQKMYDFYSEMASGGIFEDMEDKLRAYDRFQNEGWRLTYNDGEFYDDDSLGNYNLAKSLAYRLGRRSTQEQYISEGVAEMFRDVFGVRCSKGQKLSRVVNTIAKKIGLNKLPDWEKEFAKFADSVNPLNVKKWTVLSWHPVDYLLFCNGKSWSTCSTIDKKNVEHKRIELSHSSVTNYVDSDGDYAFRGEHCAATESYMFDRTSFIYYTISMDYDGKLFEEQPKETRCVFSLSEDNTTLLQSRMYPQCSDDNPDDNVYSIPREIVQRVITDSLKLNKVWTIRRGAGACMDYGISSGVHYPDYEDSRNDKCNISYIGDSPSVIHIGHEGICPRCGASHTHISSLNCSYCDPYDYDYESDWDEEFDSDELDIW